jgi:hypothetical protein
LCDFFFYEGKRAPPGTVRARVTMRERMWRGGGENDLRRPRDGRRTCTPALGSGC